MKVSQGNSGCLGSAPARMLGESRLGHHSCSHISPGIEVGPGKRSAEVAYWGANVSRACLGGGLLRLCCG